MNGEGPASALSMEHGKKISIWVEDDVYLNVEKEELRWQRNRMGRTLSPPQIHQKNI